MSKYLPATLGIAAMLLASTALAKERSDLEKSSVKAATDCVADRRSEEPEHHHAVSGRPARRGYRSDRSPFQRLRQPT